MVMTKQDFEFFAKFSIDHSLTDQAIDELLELFHKRNHLFNQRKWWNKYHKLETEQWA